MTTRGKLIRNVASNWARIGSGVFWGLILTPIFLKTLGKSDYGIWLLVNSLVGYYGLLDLGTRSAVVRYASRSIAKSEDDSTNETFNTALFVYTIVGIAALLISFALGFILPRIHGFAAGQHPDATLLIIVIGANVAVALPGKLIEGMLSAIERFDLSNGIGMGFAAGRNLIFIAALLGGANLVTLSWILLVTTVFEQSTIAVVVARKVPGLRFSLRLARKSQMREIFNYGIHSVLGQAGERLRLYTDSVVIGAFMPSAAISLFTVGQRPLSYLSKLSLGVSRVLTPAFSRTEAVATNERMANLLLLGTRGSTLVTSLACLVLLVSGPDLLHLWVGDGFTESYGVLYALLPAYLLSAGTTPVNAILLGTSRHQRLSQVTIVEGLINLGLSIWLIHPLGVLGVAIGTSAPMLVARFFVLPIYACRNIDLPYRTFLLRGLAPAIPGLLTGGLAGWLVKEQLPGNDLWSVAAVVATTGIGYLAATVIVLRATNDPIWPGNRRGSSRVVRAESQTIPSSAAILTEADPSDGLRILLIAYRFPPQGGGGVQRPAKLVKFWSRAGHKVLVLTSEPVHAQLVDNTLLDEIPREVERIEVKDPSLYHRLHVARLAGRNPIAQRLLQAAMFLVYHCATPDLVAGWKRPAGAPARRPSDASGLT
ncbi:MAG: oligosaccharide flippase family protein [Candidatus Eisenbacteria bacterium]